MLLLLLDKLVQTFPGSETLARILGYITVRCTVALVLAFLIAVVCGRPVIRLLARLRAGQFVRRAYSEDAISLFDMHAGKEGTPTMGGALILLSTLIPVLLVCDWRVPLVALAVAMAVGYAALGFWDDYLKVVCRSSKGLSPRRKLAGQACLGLAFGVLYAFGNYGVRYGVMEGWGSDGIALPFFKNAAVSLGWGYMIFAAVVLVGTSNAVNLTDGLDGLAIGVSISVAVCLGAVAYFVGRVDMAAYLIVPYVPGAGELAIIMSALVGAGMGFLWFNAPPASVFMGDTGSMMLGGLLGATALLIKQEFLLAIVGGIFVIEALSVIVQVGSYKLFHRRVFRMSPLHHHFEKCGWAESKIITRFWIVSILFALLGLSALKIR
jgi:phospho-N-acetylmuramoyl-pentapeptide-transferase